MKVGNSVSVLKQGASALALAVVVAGGAAMVLLPMTAAPSYAQGQGAGGSGGNGAGGSGGGGAGGSGGGGAGGSGGQGSGGQGGGAGQGGPSGDSEGRGGPQSGGPSDNTGGKPAWAQEGIPEVELGRLSVARSPDHVLERALDEAVANFTPAMADFYSQSLTDIITDLSLNWDELTIIDSPLQNLALFDQILTTGTTSLPGVTNDDDVLLAVFLGVASDKVVPISTDTVIALTTIFGDTMTEAEAEALAAMAESVRIAVLAGHG